MIVAVPVGGDSQGAAIVLGLLAYPRDEAARARFVDAAGSWVVRFAMANEKLKHAPTHVRSLVTMEKQQQSNQLDRGFQRINLRLIAAQILLSCRAQRRRVVGVTKHDPKTSQKIRKARADALADDRTPDWVKSWLQSSVRKWQSGPVETSTEYDFYYPSLTEVLEEAAPHFGMQPANLKRDIWTPARPVLPLAYWLLVQLERKRVPHVVDAGLKYPRYLNMIVDASWVAECVDFTVQFINGWSHVDGKLPAMKGLSSSTFVHLVADNNP